MATTPDIHRPVQIDPVVRRRILEVLRFGMGCAIAVAIVFAGAASLYVSLAPIPLREKLLKVSMVAACNGLTGAAIGFTFGVTCGVLMTIVKVAWRFCPFTGNR